MSIKWEEEVMSPFYFAKNGNNETIGKIENTMRYAGHPPSWMWTCFPYRHTPPTCFDTAQEAMRSLEQHLPTCSLEQQEPQILPCGTNGKLDVPGLEENMLIELLAMGANRLKSLDRQYVTTRDIIEAASVPSSDTREALLQAFLPDLETQHNLGPMAVERWAQSCGKSNG